MSEPNYDYFTTYFTYKGRLYDEYTNPEILDEVCRFEFLPTDIIIASYPRSGTTFTQEIVWQIKNRRSIEKEEKVESTWERIPCLELKQDPGLDIYDLKSQIDEPYRLIKTHVPFEYIKENIEKAKPKLIIIMRNAKDCLVSNFYFHSKGLKTFRGNFEQFFNLFINDQMFNGSYFDNNLQWWELRDQTNVLILFYEDLLRDLPGNVVKVADFLEETLTDDEIDKIVYNCSFSTMYHNPNINKTFNNGFTYIRKGVAGGWKDHLSEEQERVLDEMIMGRLISRGLKLIEE